MVRAFRWAVFRDVVGACRPPAERRGGGRAARSPERARHERLRLRLAHGIRTTLEDGALCARRTGGVTPNANPSLAGIRPPQQLSGAKLPLAALPGRVGPLSGKQGVGLRVAHLADAQRDVAGVTTRIVGKNLESRKTGPSDAARALSATGAEHAWLIQGIDDVLAREARAQLQKDEARKGGNVAYGFARCSGAINCGPVRSAGEGWADHWRSGAGPPDTSTRPSPSSRSPKFNRRSPGHAPRACALHHHRHLR